MKRVHTHYDNLRVARNAPTEVIRAAYKALSQKFHPDLNPGDPNASQKMAIINAAYEVLSDTQRRKAHDEWIAQAEHHVQQIDPHTDARASNNWQQVTAVPRSSILGRFIIGVLRLFWAILFAIGARFAGIAILIGALYGLGWVVGQSERKPSAASGYSSKPVYKRPAADPYGNPWPRKAGYLLGYRILNIDGRSSISVDNTRRDAAAFVKIYFVSGGESVPVRYFFLPARSQFKAEDLTAGLYDIRYRDLETGALSKSEMIELRETYDGEFFSWSDMTLTLYTVSNGNTSFQSISEEEF